MPLCAACGQPVPTRVRNTGPPQLVEHVAGEVIEIRVLWMRNYPWGRILDRMQHCRRCGELLVAGTWAVFFAADARVSQYVRAGMRSALVEDFAPDGRDAIPCDTLVAFRDRD